jgi:hypothetical protein
MAAFHREGNLDWVWGAHVTAPAPQVAVFLDAAGEIVARRRDVDEAHVARHDRARWTLSRTDTRRASILGEIPELAEADGDVAKRALGDERDDEALARPTGAEIRSTSRRSQRNDVAGPTGVSASALRPSFFAAAASRRRCASVFRMRWPGVLPERRLLGEQTFY